MIGKLLANRYEIIERVGGGGMAVVYKAKCRLLNRFVAVKILREELTHNDSFVHHFHVEAQAAASLSHPNIVSIYDVGHEGGLYYIVMELVEGVSLKQYIVENGALSPRRALSYASQIALALEHAHQKHIIHRDIKPHNILINKDGVLKVTDFGIAHMTTEDTIRLGAENIGSVHYLSPEQAKGKATNEQSDLYSLGIVLFEMLCGRVPFDGDTPIAVAMKNVQEDPPLLCEFCEGIPQNVQAIVTKALQKDMAMRYPSATVFYEELKSVLDDPHFSVRQREPHDHQATRKIPVVKEEGGQEMRASKKGGKNKQADKMAIVAALVTAIIIIMFTVAFLINANSGGPDVSEDKVPDLVGKMFNDVNDKYENSKVVTIMRDGEEFNDSVQEGAIISQTPKANEDIVTKPVVVRVVVSKGEKAATLPKLTNKDVQNAKVQLDNEGIGYEVVEEYSDSIPIRVVIRTEPPAGSEVTSKDVVKLYISKGPEASPTPAPTEKPEEALVTVPNLVGKSITQARSLITSSGLTVGTETLVKSSQTKGTVLKQSVQNGEQVAKQTVINLEVSDTQTLNKKNVVLSGFPKDKETVNVRVEVGGKVQYNGTLSTSSSNQKIEVYGTGVQTVEVFFDGASQTLQTIDFGN